MLNPYEIVCALTGSRAEAEDEFAALVAARTLAHDAFEQLPVQGREKAARATLYITHDGTYAGILTTFARQGVTL